MDYGKEEWIKVYTRDTASWRCTSLAARGLALELSRNMGRFSDEISLGARGLRAVAGLVNAPWEEVEPLLTELLRDARLEYYPDRQVLRDPEHLVRQEAVTSDAQRKRDSRARGRMQVTRGHDESRDAGHVSPQVTLGHDQKEEREEREERECARARDVADAPEPEPPQRSVTDPPPWVDDAIATAQSQLLGPFDRTVVWLAYQGDRTSAGRSLNARDFLGYLAKWSENDKKQRIREASRPPPASAARLRAVPDTPPAPYHASARELPDDAPPISPEDARQAAARLAAAVGL